MRGYCPVKFISLFVTLLINACQVEHDVGADKVAILNEIVAPTFKNQDYLITDFGGMTADTLVANRKAFNKAIDECTKNGGGRVIVPKGNFRVNGPVHLKSNVELHLKEGAVVTFGSDPSDYLPVVKTSWEGTIIYNYSPFIYACQASNVAITGKGIIDGQGHLMWEGWKAIQSEDQLKSREMNWSDISIEDRVFGDGHFLRPHLIQLFDCKNVLVQDVKIEDSPFWCLHLLKCENVTVSGISFDAQNKNNDGIDLEYSQNVLIENVEFDNGDDNIAIKAGRDFEGRKLGWTTRNIVIRNCRLKGLHGIVVGSEMSAGVENVFVDSCFASGYLKRGIYLKTNPDRGGFIRNLHFNHMVFEEVEDCFFITSFYHSEGKGFASRVSDVHITNISCKRANGSAIVIQGYPELKVSDIYIADFHVKSAANAISMQDVENIIFNDTSIGQEIGAPSYVQ